MSGEFEWFIGEDALIGTLITRLKDGSYLIYFPYTIKGIRHIREGRLVAVRNFHSNGTQDRYSVLELVEVQPVHHALGVSPERIKSQFPGFVIEAARSCRMDWEQREPLEETTVIHAIARPTGIQLSLKGNDFDIERDESMPMVGESVILLTSSGMERIINYRVEDDYAISPCWHATEGEVQIKLDARELLETHVGVFGFTGTGKSNLISTITSHMLDLDWNLRVVLMDYMFEYFPLLADCFLHLDQALLLLDFLRIPGGDITINALSHPEKEDMISSAAQLLVRSMTKPRRLRSGTAVRALEDAMFQCLVERKIRVLLKEPTGERVSNELRQIIDRYDERWLGKARHAIETWVENIAADPVLDAEKLWNLSQELNRYANNGNFPTAVPAPKTGERRQSTLTPTFATRYEGLEKSNIKLSSSAVQCIREMADRLQELSRIWEKAEDLRKVGTLDTIENLVRRLNQEMEERMLIVFYSESPDSLRATFAEIARRLYDERRVRGQNEPPVLLIIDEADEFVPGKARELGRIFEISRTAAETIARRGRKLGLGLCIATQRAGYLDTRMMGQLHTYFISKLPRKYDREVVADAFGIDRNVVDEALHFSAGQWLVISHTATGMQGVPIPARFQNAEDRVLERLRLRSQKLGNFH